MLYRLAVVLKRTKEVIYCQVPLKKKKLPCFLITTTLRTQYLVRNIIVA